MSIFASLGAALAIVGLAATIPIFGVVGVAFVFSAALMLLGLIVAQTSRTPGDWLFAAVMLVPFILGIVAKAGGIQLFGVWQVPVLLLALLGLPAFLKAASGDGFLRVFPIVFALFLLWGLVASVAGRTRPLAGAYQFASNLKPLLAVLLGFAILWTPRVERILRFLVHWTWLPALLLVAFEWLAPGLYFRVFPGPGFARASIDPTGLLPSRAVGLFEHPSFQASMAAFFAIVSVAYLLHARAATGNKTRYGILTGLYVLLIVCAVQRQEIAAGVTAILAMFVLGRRTYLTRRLLLNSVLVALVSTAFWFVYSENILKEFAMWGIGHRTVEHPRAQIFLGAWGVASDYFPLGAGLGTYGGAGAAKFDESLYRELGFGRYWWFGREDYLLDTYWPNSLGETGFVGAGLLLMAYLALFLYGARKGIGKTTPDGARLYWAAATGGMAYMLLLSVTSPAFQDPRLFEWPALLFGVAYGAHNRMALAR